MQGSGFRVQGSGFRLQASGFRLQGLGFRVQGSGFRVQGSGFRVQGSHPHWRPGHACRIPGVSSFPPFSFVCQFKTEENQPGDFGVRVKGFGLRDFMWKQSRFVNLISIEITSLLF